MGKQILVNASSYEARVAILEDGEIKNLHIERQEDRNVVGNIYKGVVKRVLPGMQAAFLELGLERTAFLYVDDIIDDPLGEDVEYADEEDEGADDYDDRDDRDYPEDRDDRDSDRDDRDYRDTRDARDTRDNRDSRDSREGREERGPRGRDDDRGRERGGRGRDSRGGRGGRGGRGSGGGRGRRANRYQRGRRGRRQKRDARIEDLIKEGQELMVQVAKAPIGTKGARLTTHLSLPGRNLVLMPMSKHIGISRRIESDRERRRLRDIFLKKIQPKDVGFIIRTVAAGKSLRDLKADADYLIKLWNRIKRVGAKAKAPAAVHEDLQLSLRAVRDFLTDDVDSFVIDNAKAYEEVVDFIGQFMPRLKNRVKLFKGPSQLFEHYGIEAEISRALGRKVWLKSGGYLLIDQSEALTSIDVNTGRYVGSKSLEETILKTNLEAVKEISYQLRIRNVGGIIIMDLIDMENPDNKEKVFRALHEALAEDKAKTNILKISDLGLVEMTRKRTHEDLVRSLTEGCEYCEGRGYHKSRQTIAFEIFREIEKEALNDCKNIVVFAHPDVVAALTGDELTHVEELEDRFDKGIIIKNDPNFHVEQFEVFGKN
ncbi:MAG: Rne/Rng family ribonuclease [Bdellovibrionaceae bacterium]|nr:Rne/Rng family ribonuclease [Bdellovibrionales bacterium]MCB9253614.1 Rne/Rng family ribonuclease [Pseudobdellovibrionaceae bacterium]